MRINIRITRHFEVLDAWFELTSKGMSLIIRKPASFDEAGGIKLRGRDLRLFGSDPRETKTCKRRGTRVRFRVP